MKLGAIMTVCCRHQMQEEAWTTARQYSRPETPIYVLFNGIDPWPLPEGIQTLHQGGAFLDEADLWNYGLRFAIDQGWDWVFFLHDDFSMREPGWESDMEKSEGWRVALAGWFVYKEWDRDCVGHWPTAEYLGVCIDPLSIGFNVRVFAERGYIAQPEFEFGFGAWDVDCWALTQGYAVWHIPRNNWHQWIVNENARTKLNKGAAGHPAIRTRWIGKALPARIVDGESIEVVDQVFRVAPEGEQASPVTRTVTIVSAGATSVLPHDAAKWGESDNGSAQ